MNPEDLEPALRDLPQLVVGAAIFLLPGIAAADRLVPRHPLRWVLAPVLAFTLLPVAGLLLNFAAGLPAAPATTAILACALTILFAGPRLAKWMDLEAAQTDPSDVRA